MELVLFLLLNYQKLSERSRNSWIDFQANVNKKNWVKNQIQWRVLQTSFSSHTLFRQVILEDCFAISYTTPLRIWHFWKSKKSYYCNFSKLTSIWTNLISLCLVIKKSKLKIVPKSTATKTKNMVSNKTTFTI